MKACDSVWIFTYCTEEDLNAVLPQIREDDCIIGVDSGLDILFKQGVIPNLLIGDMDSVSDDVLKKLNEIQSIIKLETEKDDTDTEAAVEWCLSKGYTNLKIVNSMGGRFDHCLGIISHLEYIKSKGAKGRIISANQEIFIAESYEKLDYVSETVFSLCPLSEEVEAVETENCYYPLNKETLYRNRSRGISNIIKKSAAGIRHGKGDLLVIVQKRKEEKFSQDDLYNIYYKKEGCYA